MSNIGVGPGRRQRCYELKRPRHQIRPVKSFTGIKKRPGSAGKTKVHSGQPMAIVLQLSGYLCQYGVEQLPHVLLADNVNKPNQDGQAARQPVLDSTQFGSLAKKASGQGKRGSVEVSVKWLIMPDTRRFQ